jgi:hypothetical protein
MPDKSRALAKTARPTKRVGRAVSTRAVKAKSTVPEIDSDSLFALHDASALMTVAMMLSPRSENYGRLHAVIWAACEKIERVLVKLGETVK